jgi:hypothetical protein
MQKNFVKKLLDFDETVIDGHILQKGLMNHFRVWKIIAVGGNGVSRGATAALAPNRTL